MEYELNHYYQVKYAFVCARQSFLKDPPKDDYEEYAKKVIERVFHHSEQDWRAWRHERETFRVLSKIYWQMYKIVIK